ncbi:unnamed protein product [Ambrosiozyma monospora]|uniref:Proteasome assembly chaperone 2 n=1 Tax=Ambrosiozyma monospora TaxID=43982 RepID=A0A9W7DJP2_AMBMO|nr:unnamed protein product [Ambrosiozyma monospora]
MDVLSQLTNSTLVLPIVSIGNIPQLSVDLLIANFPDVKLVGRLDDTYLYPFASPIDTIVGPLSPNSLKHQELDNDAHPGISTALEIYYCEKLNVTLLQQRSPLIPGLLLKFLKDLIKPFIQSMEFKKVVVLQSQDKGLVEVADLGPLPAGAELFSIWSNLETSLELLNLQGSQSDVRAHVQQCDNANEVSIIGDQLIKLISQRSGHSQQSPEEVVPTPKSQDQSSTLPSSAQALLFESPLMTRSVSSIHQLLKNNEKNSTKTVKTVDATGNIEFLLFNIYAYEGDNSIDAIAFTRKIVELLKLNVTLGKNLKKPKSWSSFYGSREIPLGMEYGLYT